LTVRQLPLSLDDRHVAAGRKLPEEFARLGARLFEGKRESFAKEAVGSEAPEIL
jgi:hypothetical protein